MIILFVLSLPNILTTSQIVSFLSKNNLNQRPYNLEPLWSFLHFEKNDTIQTPISFDESLHESVRKEPDFKNFESYDNLMFSILNYNLKNTEIHDSFIAGIISNVLINIFNPTQHKWARDYVLYFVTKQKTYPDISGLNKNVIGDITGWYSFEWCFSKILGRDEQTINILETMFDKINAQNQRPLHRVTLMTNYFKNLNFAFNLLAIFLEITRYMKLIPETSHYYYELCGISSYFFARLAMFEFYRADNYNKNLNQKEALDKMIQIQNAMLILYYCVRIIADENNHEINEPSDIIIDLLCACLQQINRYSFSLIRKAINCISIITEKLKDKRLTPRSIRFFNYLRCYVLPISIYSEKYINDLFEMLLSDNNVPSLCVPTLFYNIEDYYNLTMFLVTK